MKHYYYYAVCGETGVNLIVEDVKGLKTPVYKLKRKLFLNKYGSDIIFKEV